MTDYEQLPIPKEWNLHCPHCRSPLAGMTSYECRICGQPFEARRLLAVVRPIPDIGLECPECEYSLTGLTQDRCPECGERFNMRDLLSETQASNPFGLINMPPDHHIRKREAAYTGRERPLPDFGLFCGECKQPLAGAPDNNCPHCRATYRLEDVIPDYDWCDVIDWVPDTMLPFIRSLLYDAQIPFLLDNQGFKALYGDSLPLGQNRLLVPREFFLDALQEIASAESKAEQSDEEWICRQCSEQVPGSFEVCWNCNSPRRDCMS